MKRKPIVRRIRPERIGATTVKFYASPQLVKALEELAKTQEIPATQQIGFEPLRLGVIEDGKEIHVMLDYRTKMNVDDDRSLITSAEILRFKKGMKK